MFKDGVLEEYFLSAGNNLLQSQMRDVILLNRLRVLLKRAEERGKTLGTHYGFHAFRKRELEEVIKIISALEEHMGPYLISYRRWAQELLASRTKKSRQKPAA